VAREAPANCTPYSVSRLSEKALLALGHLDEQLVDAIRALS
jgi:hypothetical protein